MSGAVFERERYEAAEREAEEREEEAPELSEKERQKRDRKRQEVHLSDSVGVLLPPRMRGGYRLGRGTYYNPVAGLIILILLFFLVNFGVTVGFFAMIFLIADIACIGKVGGSARYYRKV